MRSQVKVVSRWRCSSLWHKVTYFVKRKTTMYKLPWCTNLYLNTTKTFVYFMFFLNNLVPTINHYYYINPFQRLQFLQEIKFLTLNWHTDISGDKPQTVKQRYLLTNIHKYMSRLHIQKKQPCMKLRPIHARLLSRFHSGF